MFAFNNNDITGIVWENMFCREVENWIGMQEIRIIELWKSRDS